ncbi:ArpU family transcriptional regulator [Limosilactobacillus fermentum]
MPLFREIDRHATAWRVIRFLDKPMDHYLALSGKRRADLKSPVLDSQLKGAPTGNASEDRMLNIWLAEQVVDCVGCAMRNMTRESQKILINRYSDQMLTYNIAQELNISAATYSRKQERALCEFADRFEFQVMKHNIIGEVSDLHVYLENDK